MRFSRGARVAKHEQEAAKRHQDEAGLGHYLAVRAASMLSPCRRQRQRPRLREALLPPKSALHSIPDCPSRKLANGRRSSSYCVLTIPRLQSCYFIATTITRWELSTSLVQQHWQGAPVIVRLKADRETGGDFSA